jgi:CRP-like cAMP-binding protein
MEELFAYLSTIHPLSEDLKDVLIQKLIPVTLRKKSYHLRKGQVCRTISFIQTGLVRCFYIKDDREVSSWFMKEGDVIVSVESFFKQQPSYESIQVLEDCEMLSLRYDDLQQIYRDHPEFNFVGRVLTEKYYTLSEQRLYSLRMQRASERYAHLMEHYPELIRRVPSTYISTYLGITLETLSRIKHY